MVLVLLTLAEHCALRKHLDKDKEKSNIASRVPQRTGWVPISVHDSATYGCRYCYRSYLQVRLWLIHFRISLLPFSFPCVVTTSSLQGLWVGSIPSFFHSGRQDDGCNGVPLQTSFGKVVLVMWYTGLLDIWLSIKGIVRIHTGEALWYKSPHSPFLVRANPEDSRQALPFFFSLWFEATIPSEPAFAVDHPEHQPSKAFHYPFASIPFLTFPPINSRQTSQDPAERKKIFPYCWLIFSDLQFKHRRLDQKKGHK